MGTIEIAGVEIGPNSPVRVIGELGICHRGDIDLAKRLATACSDAGADFIKFEIYQLETALTEPYRDESFITFGTACNGVIEQNLFEAFKSGFLSFDAASELIEHLHKLGNPFFATAASIQEVDFLVERGACAIKLSSGEIDHLPLIHHVAHKEMPMFIDSATTYMWEVVRAVEEYELEGGERAVVMVNPAGYPAPPETTDLNRIPSLQACLDIPIGYTCHTPGRNALMAAIGKGAQIVEKPISPDNTLPYVEYVFSENIEDFKSLVQDIDYISRSRGSARRLWGRDEMRKNRLNRHGIVASRKLAVGMKLSGKDIEIARPGYGIRPEHIHAVRGFEIKKSLQKGETINWSDFKTDNAKNSAKQKSMHKGMIEE